jgi:hypothetical protein
MVWLERIRPQPKVRTSPFVGKDRGLRGFSAVRFARGLESHERQAAGREAAKMKSKIDAEFTVDQADDFEKALLLAAGEAHPNWEILPNGNLCWQGGKGPRTPHGLEKWFIATYPHEVERIAASTNFAVTRRSRRRHLHVINESKQRMSHRDLLVEVEGNEIIVTMRGTRYTVAYYKPTNSAQLLTKPFRSRDERGALMSYAEFLVHAWKAANYKARELGWTV